MNKIVDIVIPVFNGEDVICETIEAIAQLDSPTGWELGVIVADDGSNDATPHLLTALTSRYPWLSVTRAEANLGRSAACNLGARASKAEVIVFCDADCRYKRLDTVAAFVNEVEQGADVVIGLVEARGEGFWARYCNTVAQQRPDAMPEIGLMAFTMANVAVRSDVFWSLEGFSSEYSKYGFEDKDFLVRLEQAGAKVVVRPDLTVSHDDRLTVDILCRKARIAGQYSGPLFRQQHPEHYSRLAYAKCDAHTGLLPIPNAIAPIAAFFTRKLATLGACVPGIPFIIRRSLVRVAVCAAYHDGSRISER